MLVIRFIQLIIASCNDLMTFRSFWTLTSVILILSALLYKVFYVGTASPKGRSPPSVQLPGWRTTRSFFEKRFNFLENGFKTTSSSIFQITLFRYKTIVLSGDKGRQLFFREKAFRIYDSFFIMMGSGGAVPFDPHQVNGILKRMALVQRTDHLRRLIPSLLHDCQRKMDSWVSEHILDPCSSLHEITFQLIMRVASSDIANDPILVSRLKPSVDCVDSITNPYLTWFPWLPGPVSFQKLLSSIRIYRIVQKVIRARKRSGVKEDDLLQQMLDDGESTVQIFGTMLGLSLVGSRATGTIAAWLIIQLSCNPKWSSAVQEEIKSLISTYTSASLSVAGEALTQALSEIPLTAWETQTPNLDLCIRETLRTSQPYTAVRRNTGPDITIGPYTIPSGALVVYPFSDTALDQTAYPDPIRWDPSRVTGKETPFLGWGAGTHACKGQRLGTLNLKFVVACALMRFDIMLVDGQGVKMETPPLPDWNDPATCRPLGGCGIKVAEKCQ